MIKPSNTAYPPLNTIELVPLSETYPGLVTLAFLLLSPTAVSSYIKIPLPCMPSNILVKDGERI